MPAPNSRRLAYDPLTGMEEIYHFDPDTFGFSIETKQDVQGLIELNKSVINDNTGWKGELHHVAHIPNVVVMDLAQQGIMTPAGKVLDEKRFKAWLNARENQAFRVKRGRV